MVVVTFITKEFSVTQLAEQGGRRELAASQGLFCCDEIGAVLSFAGAASFTVTGMVFVIIVIITLIAVIAEIGFTEEPFKRIATVIVFTFFDDSLILSDRVAPA